MEIETDIISADIRNDIAYVVLIEKVLQVSSGRRIQGQSIATNIFELMAQKWYLIHHHGSPLMR